MLVLSRNLGEKVIIDTSDGPITVMPISVHGAQVKLGFEGPKSVAINREEIRDKIQQEKTNEH
ncbi:MAG: carbon storage regulator [Pseudomonadota bacterium]